MTATGRTSPPSPPTCVSAPTARLATITWCLEPVPEQAPFGFQSDISSVSCENLLTRTVTTRPFGIQRATSGSSILLRWLCAPTQLTCRARSACLLDLVASNVSKPRFSMRQDDPRSRFALCRARPKRRQAPSASPAPMFLAEGKLDDLELCQTAHEQWAPFPSMSRRRLGLRPQHRPRPRSRSRHGPSHQLRRHRHYRHHP